MTFETDSSSLPPYEQLPASHRLSRVLEDRGVKTLLRHVENIIFYLSSTEAEPEMIRSIKEMCTKEFNQCLVKRQFGILEEDWEVYQAFESEVDEELQRRGWPESVFENMRLILSQDSERTANISQIPRRRWRRWSALSQTGGVRPDRYLGRTSLLLSRP